MEKMRLGKTELMVTRTAFGALPVQRCDMDYAVRLLRRAYEGGINYFDTANMYTDSEEKIGRALHDVRGDIVISTKSTATDRATTAAHIELSLKRMQTDYIDLFQFHNVKALPDPNDENGAFAAALEAKEKGLIRHIGITTHRRNLAEAAIESGLYETLQYPFSYIGDESEYALADKCREKDMGFIAMKALAGGLITNAAAARAFIRQFDNVVPIWGIQTFDELEQWLALENGPAEMTDELKAVIAKDRNQHTGNFCRSCGYCEPCPVDIEIHTSARMNMLLRRAVYQDFLTDEWHEKMHRIDDCLECGQCSSRCPFGLDTPKLLKYMLADYDEFYAAHKGGR